MLVDLLNDTAAENTESFSLQIENAVLIQSAATLTIADDTGLADIVDDDVDNAAVLANMTDITGFGIPDPAGIAYVPTSDRLVIVDSEVDEEPVFSPTNLFELTRGGALIDSHEATSFSDEPTGVAYNPVTDSLFVTDDDQTTVFEVSVSDPTQVLSQFSTTPLGPIDLEDVTVDPVSGNLFLADEGGRRIVETTTGGTLVGEIALPAEMKNPEAVAYDATNEIFYVSGFFSADIFMFTRDGTFIDKVRVLRDFRHPQTNGRFIPKGLELAPSSDPNDDPDATSLFVVDYGIDEFSDGRLAEILLPVPSGMRWRRAFERGLDRRSGHLRQQRDRLSRMSAGRAGVG